MSEQSCDTCTHWADLGDDIGQCRRYAPRPRAGTDEVRWPTTEADDWCGDWESVECDCDDNEVCGICGPDPVDIEFDHIVGSLFTTKPRRRWWQFNIKRRTN